MNIMIFIYGIIGFIILLIFFYIMGIIEYFIDKLEEGSTKIPIKYNDIFAILGKGIKFSFFAGFVIFVAGFVIFLIGMVINNLIMK